MVLIDLLNRGKDCWSHCSYTQGPCLWCGLKGMCCTTNQEWTNASDGCYGTFEGSTDHACVLKPGKIFYPLIESRFQNIFFINHKGNVYSFIYSSL